MVGIEVQNHLGECRKGQKMNAGEEQKHPAGCGMVGVPFWSGKVKVCWARSCRMRCSSVA
jgi:hypothetical protein